VTVLAAPQVEPVDLAKPSARAEYDGLFASCPGAFVQQSSDWAEVIAPLGPDEPVFLLARHDGEPVAGLPLYHFRADPGDILTSVPQPGPLGGVFTRPGLSDETRRAATTALLHAALRAADDRGCVALTVITSPFEDDLALYEDALRPDVVFENFTQYIPLADPPRRAGGQRNNLARARRFGFELGFPTDRATFEAWYDLHVSRQGVIGAVPLSRTLLGDIFDRLVPRGRAVLITTSHQGRLTSGCLYVYHRDVFDVYAIAMDSDYAEHAPNALVADASMDWARERGARFYNWQSSPGRASGVYNNKRQWGSLESPYAFVTRILKDRDRLARLSPDTVRSAYPGHYLLPFPALQDGLAQRRYRKA
jgi:hypothetical protein